MSYNSYRPLSGYSILEVLSRSEPSADYCYYTRPEFAYFEAGERRCFREPIPSLSSPCVEIGDEAGRVSSNPTDDHIFDIGLGSDPAVAGKIPIFSNRRQTYGPAFNQDVANGTDCNVFIAARKMGPLAHAG